MTTQDTTVTTPYGQYISNVIVSETPMIAALVGGIYNHFGGPLPLIVPADVLVNAVKTVIGKLSDAVKNQTVALSVPTGFVADALTEIEAVVPGALAKLEAALDPQAVAVFKSIGILPAS